MKKYGTGALMLFFQLQIFNLLPDFFSQVIPRPDPGSKQIRIRIRGSSNQGSGTATLLIKNSALIARSNRFNLVI